MTTPQDILATHEVRLESSTKPLGTSADALVLGVRHDGELAVPSDVKAGVRRRPGGDEACYGARAVCWSRGPPDGAK
ncbi:hypothetical protein K1Y78_50180 [Streptomyces sp. tea 10]|nr:hypothetical protein [Streptomyces sp. tea 10]